MKIYVNDKYAITSDPDQFIISIRSTYKSDQKDTDTKKGAKAGDELLKPLAYVHTLRQCYRYLLLRQVRESDCEGFKAVMIEVERIEKELRDAINI